jgi:hypothetical protein
VCAVFAQIVAAQASYFDRIGQIRAVVSETETTSPSWAGTIHDAKLPFIGVARSRVDYYFVHAVDLAGTVTEKWSALPNDRVWSPLSNRPVKLTGKLNKARLTDVTVVPLDAIREATQAVPPPTTGLYKIVSVPLTIQTTSAQRNASVLSVTPEQIRDTLFNFPNSVSKFYREASYGMLEFTGVQHPQVDVVPVTIQATISANCQEQIINEFTPVVRQRLAEQNINTMNGTVDLGLIIFNDTPGCPPYPFATRGALGARGVPLWVWMPESWFVTGPAIVAHEMAHALGGNHPYTWRCTDFDDRQTCVTAEANDRDLMTAAGAYYVMPNNYERRRWGWYPPGAFVTAMNSASYLFDLRSPVLPYVKDGQRQGRFYFRNLAGSYAEWEIFPEARQNYGQFERYNAVDVEYLRGVTLRYGHANYPDPEALAILLDPNSTATVDDAPLRQGEQISMGGTLIKCIRESSPQSGTRMTVQ